MLISQLSSGAVRSIGQKVCGGGWWVGGAVESLSQAEQYNFFTFANQDNCNE
jgi:hypothetical protein